MTHHFYPPFPTNSTIVTLKRLRTTFRPTSLTLRKKARAPIPGWTQVRGLHLCFGVLDSLVSLGLPDFGLLVPLGQNFSPRRSL